MRTAIRAIEKFLGEARHMAAQVRKLAQNLEDSARSAQELSTRFTHLGQHSARPHGFQPLGSRSTRAGHRSRSSALDPEIGPAAVASPETELGPPARSKTRRAGAGAGFLTGALIGACMALLFAPRSGRDARLGIRQAMRRLKPGPRLVEDAGATQPTHEHEGSMK